MSQHLRALFIGSGDRKAVSAELEREGFDVESAVANSGGAVEEALQQSWDIVISDYKPGTFGALEVLATIEKLGRDLPLIVISGKLPAEAVLTVLAAGAADHLTSPNLMRLSAAVRRELRAARLRGDRTRLEEQFRQAQKMEAVGRLAGGVAHDFNNLLTVITGYSDLLLARGELTDSQRSAIEEIRRSAERGGALTFQLLAFSRRQPLEPRVLHLNELVLGIEKMLRRLIGEDVVLVTAAGARPDTVEADPGRLEQVIMNVVVNARDAMPEGGKLTIETATTRLGEEFTAKQLGLKPGRYVRLSITDTGVGMGEETRSHLFEPFFTTKNPGRGTGLGLATAYGIIRQSAGAISITSDPGKGTSVQIFLPVVKSKVNGTPETGVDEPVPGGDETVLVVEDEGRVRKLISDVLRGQGYTVIGATRGDEALRLCRAFRGEIHLALVDVVMPEMNGPDLVRALAALRPSLRVLFMSGYTDETVGRHGLSESGAAFLQKPFLPAALARKVREVLDAQSNRAG
jgi:two-component system, cell cycle sensor histidine kinase and response regulator CckA